MVRKLLFRDALEDKDVEFFFEGDGPWILGRDPEESVWVIDNPSVSRKHALFSLNSTGISIENMSETNPILLNDIEIEKSISLSDGDILTLGDVLLKYIDESLEEEGEEDLFEGVQSALERARIKTEKEDVSLQEIVDIDRGLTEQIEKETGVYGVLEEGEEAFPQIHFDILELGRFVLKVVSGPNLGAEFSLDPKKQYLIGTDPLTCDIVFHDISVSRQHARIHLDESNKVVIEDLGSKNGVFVQDKRVEGQQAVDLDELMSLGTTTFVVVDRDAERNTIISPILPSLVKVLQKQESDRIEQEKMSSNPLRATFEEREEKEEEASYNLVGAFIVVALLSGLFAVGGYAISTLLETAQITEEKADYQQILTEKLKPFPGIKFTFNDAIGRLLLVGHVQTAVERNQLLFALQPISFIKSIDDNVIIDEFVWRELNQVLSKNPKWKGVSMISPEAGKFVLTGYLDTRDEMENLIEYVNQNFSYPGSLENRVIVQEDVLSKGKLILSQEGLGLVKIDISSGDAKVSGSVTAEQQKSLETALAKIKDLPGVRSVINLVVEQTPKLSSIDLTAKFNVTGSSLLPGGERSVVIAGRILKKGDYLGDLLITDIDRNTVYLQKEGIKYRINY